MKPSIAFQNYDNATQHFLGNFPESLPIEQAYVHIGMYLGWIIDNGLYSSYFEDEAASQIFRFKRKEISCTILSQIWNGDLPADILSDLGNSFSTYYYSSGLYRSDYEEVLTEKLPTFYHVPDNWNNYDNMRTRISRRFHEWYTLRNNQ